jgi:hypothetical protein
MFILLGPALHPVTFGSLTAPPSAISAKKIVLHLSDESK